MEEWTAGVYCLVLLLLLLKIRALLASFCVMNNESINRIAELSKTHEKDLERMGGWPFPRKTLAGIHNELMYNGALGVGWVIAFPPMEEGISLLVSVTKWFGHPTVVARMYWVIHHGLISWDVKHATIVFISICSPVYDPPKSRITSGACIL